MGSVFTCKLDPCCGDRYNCEPPHQYQPSDSPALEAGVAEARKWLQWIADARDDENADLDTICTYADQALAALSIPAKEDGK